MKRGIIAILSIAIMVTSSGLAAAAGGKGANIKAYEHADDNAVFNRVGDWFATVGKSDIEKNKIRAERKAQRAKKRVEKQVRKNKKKAKKLRNDAKRKMSQKR